MSLTHNRYKRRILSLLLLDLLLFGLTDATSVPSFMVIIGFGLFALTLYCLIYALTGLTALYGLQIRRKKYFSFYATSVIGGLVALQSIGQLGLKDVLVVMPLVAIAYFYSAYAKSTGV
jgi:hypothetical protein